MYIMTSISLVLCFHKELKFILLSGQYLVNCYGPLKSNFVFYMMPYCHKKLF